MVGFDIDGEVAGCPKGKVKRYVGVLFHSIAACAAFDTQTNMPHGLPNHLDLTVSDLARSSAFYDLVLTTLGYAKSSEYAGDVPCWVMKYKDVRMSRAQDAQERPADGAGGAFSIGLHQARSDRLALHSLRSHDRYSTGLHHFALHADSRADIDAFHALLVNEGVTVLDAPAEYDYTPGYYAVFFADPDGMKLELVHEPRFDAR